MKLPPGITAEQTLSGRGHGDTIHGKENGQPVIVKSPDTSIDLFGSMSFEDEAKPNAGFKKFESEKKREQEVAEKSSCFVKGRLEHHEETPFWIRPFLQRSLHDKVAFKETPDSVELAQICRAIVKALIELNRIDQSGHGNLSLGNVLIPDKNVSDLKLVDLLVAEEGNRQADKRALGLIIYQLVNGEFVELDDKVSAVPDDQDWKAMGAAESMWRELCSELLNPYGKYAKSDWEELDRDLKSIEAFHSKRQKLKALSAVSLLLVCGTGIFFIWKLKFKEEEIVVDLDTIQGQWIELLDNYFSWGDSYIKSKADFDQADEAKEFMGRFYDSKRARLPLKIIGRVSGQGARIQVAPNEVYEKSRTIDVLLLDNSKQQQIALAHRFLMGLRDEIENWEVLQELSEANAAFIDSGFEFGARETRRLIDSISFDDGSLSLSRLYGLQTSAAGLDELQDLYTRFESQVTALSGQKQTRFLPLYATEMRQRLRQPADDPVAHLRALVDTSLELLNYWQAEQPNIAQELFFDAERTFLKAPGFAVSDESMNEWKKLLEGFRLIEIPLLEPGREQFAESKENIIQLVEQINELQEPELEPATFDQQFDKLFEQFQSKVDIPPIESNREAIETAVRENLSALQSLVEKAEDRWAEVNPDIGERLKQLSQAPESLSGDLLAAWEDYLNREVIVLTEESFPGPREFIVFQRGYFSKLKNFEYFQDKQLSQLPKDWPDGIPDSIRQDLAPALQTTRQIYYDRLVFEWVEQIVPDLFDAKTKKPLEKPTAAFLKRMKAYETKLLSYAQLLGETLDTLDSWQLPDGGIVDRWNALNKGDLEKEWGQSAPFAQYASQVEVYSELEQESDAGVVLALIQDVSQPAFARILALEKNAELTSLSPDAVGQVAGVVPELFQQVPDREVERVESALKTAWIQAFKNEGLDSNARETILSHHEAMKISASDLSGDERFYFEVYTALTNLRNNETLYLEDPLLLEKFIDTFASLSEDSRVSEVTDLIAAMREVDLNEVKETFEDAPFLAKGWTIESETEDQLVLNWQDYELAFHRIEDEQGDFFLAEQECSIGLFNDWMTINKLWEESADSLPREWEVFVSQAYNAIDDYREGMKLWSISRRGLTRGGITVSESWFEVDPVVADEYSQIAAEIFSPGALNESLPVQQVGARLARTYAESMGMALPTPSQWKLVVQDYTENNGFFWQERLDARLSGELVDEIRTGSYYVERKIAESGYGIDQSGILARVNEPSTEKFTHLAGNVAEYLYDPEAETYYVSGGSALSATEGTWKDEHLVSRRSELTAFSDVGVRLALIAPEQSAYSQYIEILEAAWN